METVEAYKERLEGYDLSPCTRTLYLKYHKKLFKVLGKKIELNEEIANAFLKDYPISIVMAYLHDYMRWKKLYFFLEKRVVIRKPQKSKRYILPSEVEKLGVWLYKNKGVKYFLLLMLTYHCALRRSEAVGFKMQNVIKDFMEWKEKKEKNPKAKLRLTISKETAKREKERKAVVPPEIAEVLYEYIKEEQEEIVGSHHENDIFRMGVTRWHIVFKQGVRTCLQQDYTLHELRFSKATYWFQEKGMDILTIKKLLGHSDISTTQRYVDSAQELALQELESIYDE